MEYLPSIVILGSLLAVIVIIIVRGKTALWSWLFALECLVLFECVGNCFVPGSWKQFWQIEIPSFLIAVALAIASSVLRVRKENADRRSSTFLVWVTPQMLTLYAILFVVGVIVASHL